MIFPGQGSQSVGMLGELAEQQPAVGSVFARASEVLGYDVWQLVQKGPEEKLNQTEYTQPALLAADVAVFESWRALGGPLPSLLAGHSLGEYAALVCADAIHFEDAVQLVANRGRYMQAAVVAGEGAMGAIIGLDEQQVQSLCVEASQGNIVSPANFNSVGQTVVAGQVDAVNRAIVLAKERGAKIAKLIPVSVPSHCALMDPAAKRLAEDLAKTDIKSPRIPVVHNVDVAFHDDPQAIRSALVNQLVSPVRWVETIQLMLEQGIVNLVECGPGKVLAGLVKRISKEPTTLAATSPNVMAETVAEIKE